MNAGTRTAEEAKREERRQIAHRARQAALLAGIASEAWEVLRELLRRDYGGWIASATQRVQASGEREWWAGYGRHVVEFRDELEGLREEGLGARAAEVIEDKPKE